MTPDRSQWRDGEAYAYMDDLSVEDLAWECLRRNPDYQKDFGRYVRAGANKPANEAAIARRWGLRFRCPSEPRRIAPARPLDAAR